jgi:ABC-type amino acid transport substrate-binding protein
MAAPSPLSHLVPAQPGATRRDWLSAGLSAGVGLAVGRAAHAQAARPVVPLALSLAVNRAVMEPFLARLAQAAELAWDLSFVPFSRLLKMVERGEALGFGVAYSPQRGERLAFSQVLFASGVWTISRRSQPVDARTPADLKGLRVCVVPGLDYGPELEAAKGRLFEPQGAAGDFASRLRMLQAGRCDALLATQPNDDVHLLEQRVRDAGGELASLVLGRRPIVEQPVQIAVARGCDLAAHLPRIDQALHTHAAPLRRLLEQPG